MPASIYQANAMPIVTQLVNECKNPLHFVLKYRGFRSLITYVRYRFSPFAMPDYDYLRFLTLYNTAAAANDIQDTISNV